MLRSVLLVLSALTLIALGVSGMQILIDARTPMPRHHTDKPGRMVRVIRVEPRDVPLTVTGFGTVRPKRVWHLVPEVAGVVTHVSPYLRSGLHVKPHDLLLEIDPRPYRLAAQRAQAKMAQYAKEIAVLEQQRHNAEAELRLAQSNLSIANEDMKRDERLVHKGTISARERDQRRQWRNDFRQIVQRVSNNLALITPEIERTQASMAIAQVELEEAEWRLEKTRLLAPFEAQISESTVEPGEYVAAGQVVATLYATDAVEIPVDLSLDELQWLPNLSPTSFRAAVRTAEPSEAVRPSVKVHWQHGAQHYVWSGHVVRWEAGLDAKTRTATLVVEVRAPWQTLQPDQRPPLQPGMLCRVEIVARRIPEAVVIPRTALQEAQTVFVLEAGKLAQRSVSVARLLREHAVIDAGLQQDDLIIISPLAAPVLGMSLRPMVVDLSPSLAVSPPPRSMRSAIETPDAAGTGR